MVLTTLLVFSFGTALAVAVRGQGLGTLELADLLAIRFTLFQAFISTILSVGLSVPVARALSRQAFIGRRALITLLGAPLFFQCLLVFWVC